MAAAPGRAGAEAKFHIDTALTASGLTREALPKGSRTAVRDLDRPEALRLSVALAPTARHKQVRTLDRLHPEWSP